MKEWSPNHPKAGLMAKKRAVILDAAREAFLRDGYEATSMDSIAARAGVSIMTLYRHAQGKDDLFAAVVEGACHPDKQGEQAEVEDYLHRPLDEVLTLVGQIIQTRLSDPTTIALFRAVIAESSRHPQLATMAYNGLVRSHEDALETYLGQRKEGAGIDPGQRRRLSARFVDQLVGVDSFRLLLGLEGASEAEQLERAAEAAADLISQLKARP